MYLNILQQSKKFLRKNILASITKKKSGVKEQVCRQNVIQFSNSINNAELSLWLSRYFFFANISSYYPASSLKCSFYSKIGF